MRSHRFFLVALPAALSVTLALGCSSAKRSGKSDTSGGGSADAAASDVQAADSVQVDDGDVPQSDAGADGTDGLDATDDITGPDVVDPADVDGSSPEDVVEPVDTDVAPPKLVHGGILIVQVESSAVQTASVTAAFNDTPDVPAPFVAEEGACRAYAAAQSTTPPTSLDAGAINLSGLASAVTLTPAPVEAGLVRYLSGLPSDLEKILGLGTTVTATATGGADLEGFTVTADVPKTVVILTPSDDVGAAQDLTVSWVKADASLMRVDLFVLDLNTRKPTTGAVIACEVPGDPGQIVVSKALLKLLPDLGSGPFGPQGYLAVGVSRVKSAEVPLGGGSVSLGVTRTGGLGVGFDP